MALTAASASTSTSTTTPTTTEMMTTMMKDHEDHNNKELLLQQEKQDARTSPGRRRRKSYKKNDALMRAIANEMVTSFFGESEQEGNLTEEQLLLRAFQETIHAAETTAHRAGGDFPESDNISNHKATKKGRGSQRRSGKPSRKKSSNSRKKNQAATTTAAAEGNNVLTSPQPSITNHQQALADLYYSHMNGEDISEALSDPSELFSPIGSPRPTTMTESKDEDEEQPPQQQIMITSCPLLDDDHIHNNNNASGSFAGLDLGLDGFHEEEHRLRMSFHSQSTRTSSCSSNSGTTVTSSEGRTSVSDDTDDEDYEDEDEEYTTEEASTTNHSGGDHSSTVESSIVSKPLSLQDIRQQVMDQIPPELKEQIPIEAWEQIFSASSSGGPISSSSPTKKKTSRSPHKSYQIPLSGGDPPPSPEEEELQEQQQPKFVIANVPLGRTTSNQSDEDEDDDDDLSVCSELSGLTGIFPECHPQKTMISPVKFDNQNNNKKKKKIHSLSTTTSKDTDTLATEAANSSDETLLSPTPPESFNSLTTTSKNKNKNNKSKQESPRSSPPQRRTTSSGEFSVPSCATTRSTKSQKSTSNKVSFHDVQIRHYERILSDNPSCQSGPSLGIGWSYRRGGTIPVNEFESTKEGHCTNRRKSEQLIIPRSIREKILLELGYTSRELADATRTNLKIKNQRRQTVNNLNVSSMEEAVETAKRKVKSLLLFSKYK